MGTLRDEESDVAVSEVMERHRLSAGTGRTLLQACERVGQRGRYMSARWSMSMTRTVRFAWLISKTM